MAETTRDKILKIEGDMTINEIVDLAHAGRTTVYKAVYKLIEEGKLFHVGTQFKSNQFKGAGVKVYSRKWRRFKEGKRTKKVKGNKKLEIFDPADITKAIKANIEAVDRFYRGTQCRTT